MVHSRSLLFDVLRVEHALESSVETFERTPKLVESLVGQGFGRPDFGSRDCMHGEVVRPYRQSGYQTGAVG